MNKPTHIIAAIRCADGSYSIAYIFAGPKPERQSGPFMGAPPDHDLALRGFYSLVEKAALADYPDHSPATMGCGVCVTTREPLPAHEELAAESMDFSLLRQGWRFKRPHHTHAEPIPLSALGETAYAARKLIAANPRHEIVLHNFALDPAREIPAGMALLISAVRLTEV